MYWLLTLLAMVTFLQFSKCQDCPDAGFKPVEIDLVKMSASYSIVGAIFLSSNTSIVLPANQSMGNLDTCNMKYNFKFDGTDTMEMTIDDKPEYGLIKFNDVKSGIGVYNYNAVDANAPGKPVTILQFTDTLMAMSFCLNNDQQKSGISLVYVLIKSDSPVDENSFPTELDKLQTDLNMKYFYAMNFCSKGRKNGNTGENDGNTGDSTN